MGKQSTNIIYLTTECNINCEYCYQKDDRLKSPKKEITKEEITKFFEKLVTSEPGVTSTVVIFGGEPFLVPELVFFCISEADRIKKLTGKEFALCITTNGIWFINTYNTHKWINTVKNSSNYISTEISFDGTGHDRRIYKNGKSTKKDVTGVLKVFRDIGFPITIRYTIHKDNYQVILEDFIKIFEFYSGTTCLQKIVTSTFDTELDPLVGNIEIFTDNIKNKILALYSRYNIPICSIACEACKKCDFASFCGNSYKTSTEEFIIEKGKQGNFDHFSKGI